MNHNKKTRSILFIIALLILCPCSIVLGQAFSYVYIQGDKKTPIYTKVEGVMMPRYGKNYALLSRLAPGPLNIEILFQQNEFPPLQFNILVPENGKRAFVLQKKEDAFALYDVEQNFYLNPNNDIAEDHLPAVLSHTNQTIEKPFETTIETPAKTTKEIGKPKVELAAKTEEPIVNSAANDTTKTAPIALQGSSKPKFIENIVFDNEANKTTESSITTNAPLGNNSQPNIENSDCKGQITALHFSKLNNSIVAKRTENEKLGMILEATKRNCFSSEQGQKMVSNLESDIAKFTAIKGLYPKTTDQSNFSSLSILLNDEEWKSYFNALIQTK